ncbi:MAG: FAD-dependent oxidoreductase, partial [Janthinobacterium lividum]
MTTTIIYDVLILGGGPGGLAVANALARQLYTALVFNSGVFRNARAAHMHNVLGWDHQDPTVFRAKAKADILTHYQSISFQEDTTISSLARLPNGYFEVTSTTGQKWQGRKVALATSVTDVPLDIEGYDDCWGRGIFHCLFCHGYEERGSANAAVLA